MKSITQVMQNLVKPYIDTKDKAYAANIAPVEVSPAEAAHTAGTQLIYNGVLYDVTADIAINDDLATEGAGANISAASKVTEQISSVNEALSNEVTTRATLGVHNLLENGRGNHTFGTLAVTVNSDGSLKLNGTSPNAASYYSFWNPAYSDKIPNGKYIVSIEQSASSSIGIYINKYKDGNYVGQLMPSRTSGEQEVTIAYDNTYNQIQVGLVINANTTVSNLTIYPMIRLASDPDDTYQPYAATNQQLTQETTGLISNEFANGCVNLLPNNGKSETITTGGAALTCTVNSDGTIILNGTTGSSTVNFVITVPAILKNQKVKVSGCPSGGSAATYYLAFLDQVWSSDYREYGNGLEHVVSASGITQMAITVVGGQTLSNVVFKPMITLAGMPNSDYAHYVPYAKTNRELTDDICDDWKTLAFSDNAYNNGGYGFINYKKVGSLLFINIHCEVAGGHVIPAQTANIIAQLPTGYRPLKQFRSNLMATTGYAANPNIPIQCVIETTGNIVIFTNETGGFTFSIAHGLWCSFVIPC